MFLVSGWCSSEFRARPQTKKPDVTHITPYKNVFSIEHLANAVSVTVWPVLSFKKRQNFIWFG